MIVVHFVGMVVIVIVTDLHSFNDFFRDSVDHLDHINGFGRVGAERFEDPLNPAFVFSADGHE